MDTLRKSEVAELARRSRRWCVTITLPTPRRGDGAPETAIEVRNHLRDAEETLLDRGVRAAEAAAQLAPLAERAADRAFWRGPGDGLAAYLSPPEPRILRLRIPFRPRVFVGERHLVLPLLPLLDPPERLYVLALSQNSVRLVRGSREGAEEVSLGAEVASLTGALASSRPHREFQYHTASAAPRPGGARAAPILHGAGTRQHKADIEQFFRRVDAEVRTRLRADDAPVVLAGVDYLLPIYRDVSDAGNLADAELEGNPEGQTDDELHRRAVEALEPEMAARRAAALTTCRDLLGSGSSRAAGTIAAIAPLALAGRVATLVVADGACRYGALDRTTGNVSLRTVASPGDDDLVDFAAAHTFLNGGAVHVVPAADVPGGGPVAAVLRY